MKNKINYIILYGLTTQLNALTYQNNFQIGLGYDYNSSQVIASPFKDFEIKTKPSHQKSIQKIVLIKNFEDLIQKLEFEQTLSNVKNKKVQKLLNDRNINNYTLTYLIYNKVTNFESLLQSKQQDLNVTYIDSIDIGGEFIALIHIKTQSLNDYNKIKKMKVSWKDLDKFEQKLNKLSNKHVITFKNIITADDTFFPVNNLKDLIQNAKTFTKDIKDHEVPYRVHIKNKINQTSIKPYLNALQAVNNLEYIRRNREQFTYKQNINTPTIESKKISEQLTNLSTKTMTILKKTVDRIIYPKRHHACTNNIATNISTINIQSKILEKRYPKILEDVFLTVNYDFKIKIENRGSVILLNWIKTVKESDILIHQEKNSKILFDSYINFKDLKASYITGISYGNISYSTKFDSYEKNSSIQGTGIINNANCGYTIIDQSGKLEIGCKNIKIKDLEIKFKHKE